MDEEQRYNEVRLRVMRSIELAQDAVGDWPDSEQRSVFGYVRKPKSGAFHSDTGEYTARRYKWKAHKLNRAERLHRAYPLEPWDGSYVDLSDTPFQYHIIGEHSDSDQT